MTFGDILHGLTDLEKNTIRRKEKLIKKNIKTKYAIVFNQTCLQANILPAYSNVKFNGQAVAYKQFTTEFRRKFVEKQLEAKTKTYSNLQKELEKVENRYIQLDLVKSVSRRVGELGAWALGYMFRLGTGSNRHDMCGLPMTMHIYIHTYTMFHV